MANQNATVEWWETQRSKYDLVISEFVVAEASLGNPDAARRRLLVADDIMELQATEEVRLLGKELIKRGALPAKAEVDAYHVENTVTLYYLRFFRSAEIALNGKVSP